MDHEQQTAQFAELMQDIRRINIDGETIELTYHLRKFAEIFQRYISDDRTLRWVAAIIHTGLTGKMGDAAILYLLPGWGFRGWVSGLTSKLLLLEDGVKFRQDVDDERPKQHRTRNTFSSSGAATILGSA